MKFASNPHSANNEKALYEVLKRRGLVRDLTYFEYQIAARQVVAKIPSEAVTPIEEMLNALELRILANRKSFS
jgi:hypothetical protein